MNSVLIPSKTPSLRRYSYQSNNAPPLPPRRHSVAVSAGALQVKAVTQSASMDSRYYRPSSPRARAGHPARSSTGTFADPYYDPYSSTYRGGASSPRTSGERITGSHHHHTPAYAPVTTSSTRTATAKYDPYSGRRRRNTLEGDERILRPTSALPLTTTSIPIRAPGVHTHTHHHDRPSSPLARSWDTRTDTYITHGGPTRREHKKLYSVDDTSRSTKLIAEKEIIEPRRRESGDSRNYSITSGGRSYHNNMPLVRSADLGDDGYSYTNAAGMFDTTEPTWRRPRSGSIERNSRPTSMIVDRAPRTSDRALGPPPSTRGFDKINNGNGRSGSLRDHHARSSSIERTRDAPKYDSYPEAPVVRSSSTRPYAPAVHQEPRGREIYQDDPRGSSRDLENRRHNTQDRFEDREVVSRGFGIAPLNPALAHDHHALDRQPVWNAQEMGRARPEEYGAQYYPPPPPIDPRIPGARMPDPRVSDPRLPDPRLPDPRLSDSRIPDPRVPDARAPRERDVAPTYDERPRERDRDRRVSHADDRGSRADDRGSREDRGSRTDDRGSRTAPAVAGVVAGAAAATYGANEILKSRERDRERDREAERERERRKEREERERRDRVPEERRERAPEDRRDRGADDRRDRAPDDARDKVAETRDRAYEDLTGRAPEERERAAPQAALPPATASFELSEDAERKARELRREAEGRERRHRKHSSDESSEERPRHYVDRDAARESERRKEPVPKEAALDPDEEYRRRIALEAERSGRAARDREDSPDKDRDRDRERRRRRDDRDRSRSRDGSDDIRSRGPERIGNVLDTSIVQEPDSLTSPASEREPGRSVQIVAPPKEPQPAPKGILRKPTEKFPEHPEPIREGVAPHKSQLKGKDIPVDARWTKIDRRLVNPEALEAAKERFEERMDCVIVLRVLTKAEIQKLADRTKAIREAREEEYEPRDIDRERRHRSHRDDEDRDRDRRRDDDSDDDYLIRDRERERDRDRDRERERDRPRAIEAGR